jgi:hypothetical protein
MATVEVRHEVAVKLCFNSALWRFSILWIVAPGSFLLHVSPPSSLAIPMTSTTTHASQGLQLRSDLRSQRSV